MGMNPLPTSIKGSVSIVDVDGFHYFNIFNRLDTRSINYINICFRNEDLI